MSRAVLLDTHALIWFAADPERLSPRAHATIEAADDVAFSAASAWEVALLVDADRIALDRPVRTWFSDIAHSEGLRSIAIDADLAIAAVALGDRGFNRDPADRFIYATAVRERCALVSKDASVQKFAAAQADLAVVW